MRGAIIKLLAVSAFIIFFASFISAGFSAGNFSIEKTYFSGGMIRGWIDITLDKEPVDSVLESSLGGTISIIDLLNKSSNLGFVKTCVPASCTFDYSATQGENDKELNLDENKGTLIGFNISSSGRYTVTEITSFSFNVTSNNDETEKFPLSIDLLDDGQDEWRAYKPSDNFAGKENAGCFEGQNTVPQFIVFGTKYCEKITLSRSPGVEIGAYVNGNGIASFLMDIKGVDGSSFPGCTASISGGEGSRRVSCNVTTLINKEGDFFVCIQAQSASYNNKYTIEAEEHGGCGFVDEFTGVYDWDFEVFAKQRKYMGAINFTFNDSELVNAKGPVTSVKNYVKDYISAKYNNNCSRGCIIPVRIFSGVAQKVNISYSTGDNKYIWYKAGTPKYADRIYDLGKSSAKLSASAQKLYLDDAGFAVPTASGNYSVSITLGDKELVSEDINVKEGATIQSLSPMKTAVGYPTKFKVLMDSAVNVTRYDWDFGDGNIGTTSTNYINYTYTAIGDYLFKVGIIDINGMNASKTFNVSVGPASAIVPTLLAGMESKINNIKSKIATFSELEKNTITKALDLESIETTFARLKETASKATSEPEFESVLGELLGISLPDTVSKTASGDKILFYPEESSIDLEILKKIGGGDYTGKENEYKSAIFAWNEVNINTILTYSEISAIYEGNEVPFLKIFEANVANTGEEAYVIIKDMKDISFDGVTPKKDSGYYYLNLAAEKSIAFSTSENVNFITLPMFISPSLTKLSIIEGPSAPEKNNKGITLTVLIILVIVSALIIWTVLQVWYNRRYEGFLFKDRNQLYNMANYIGTEKGKGVSDKDIGANLKKTGWTSEQVSYALKKYAGRNTGMLQLIPIDKILDKIFGVNKKIKAPKEPKAPKKAQ